MDPHSRWSSKHRQPEVTLHWALLTELLSHAATCHAEEDCLGGKWGGFFLLNISVLEGHDPSFLSHTLLFIHHKE